MPNIKPIDAGVIAFKPSDMGVEAAAATGRRIGAFYNQAAQAQQTTGSRLGGALREAGDVADNLVSHSQIAAGAAHGQQLFANLLDSKDQVINNLDRNDPAYGAQVDAALKGWRDTIANDALEKFRSGFTTEKSQAWAEHFIDSTREHMFHQVAADTSQAAGISIHNAMRTTINTASNTVLNHPETLDTYLGTPGKPGTLETSWRAVVDSSPIKGLAAAKVMTEGLEKDKEQLVKNAAQGAIMKASDPEAVADGFSQRYPQYIKGDEARSLAAFARSQIRARNADFESNRRRQKEIAQDASTEQSSQYLIDIRSRDPKFANDPTAKKILNDPTLTKTDKNNLLNLIDRQLKPETEARISHQTFTGLLRDLRSPDADPEKLMQRGWDARLTDAGKPGSMNEADFNAYRREVLDRKTPEGMALSQDRGEFFKRYARSIDGAMTLGEHSALGEQSMYAAEMDARRREAELQKKGINPHELYRQGSEYFFGTPQNLQKYAVSYDAARKYEQGIGRTPTLAPITPAPAAPQESATPKAEARPPTPPPLRGIAALEWSPKRQQFRDQVTGTIYDRNGNLVK